MYSKDCADLSELEKLISHWPGFAVLGNLPYKKGCWVVQTMPHRKLTQKYKKNFDARVAILSPGYHPSIPVDELPLNKERFGKKLFPHTILLINPRREELLLLKKAQDAHSTCLKIQRAFGVDSFEELEKYYHTLKK